MNARLAECSLLAALAAWAPAGARAVEYPQPVTIERNGGLAYRAETDGDRVPDFSAAGYGGGGRAIPDLPVRVVVTPRGGDEGPRIQAAIDFVSALPADGNGRRGAVLLAPGRYEVSGQLRIEAGGVVLRGSGSGPAGTLLVATGTGRRALIALGGSGQPERLGKPAAVTDARVPVGATRLHVSAAAAFHPGDTVLLVRPSPKAWIAAVGMDVAPGPTFFSWKPGTIDLAWDRVVTAASGDEVTLDAPITTALEARFGGATLEPYRWPGRIAESGVERLRCESAFAADNPRDEQHAWMAVDLEAAENAWVRDVSGEHFVSSLVQVGAGCKEVTIEDCACRAPVSELAGYRRNAFHTDGQLTLFLRCRSEEGRNDFTAGYQAAGPNVFLDCAATGSSGFSGSIGSWASGLLFDNVELDGGSLRLGNLETWNQGVGWAAANSMAWQCSLSRIVCREPPGANNWAVGTWGEFVGDGRWSRCNEFVKPDSLYRAQLAERLGPAAVRALGAEPGDSGRGGAPALEQAVPDLAARLTPSVPAPGHPLVLKDGWLTADGRLLIGRQVDTGWWRGFMLPAQAAEPGPAITRFAPGRTGVGWTDDLGQLTDGMAAAGEVAFRHHWGLWYDERSDDHERTRRPDAEVWPPFYEQPWLRSGEGTAWDGLSRYDLSRYNPWYFRRLRQFAELARAKGLVLVDEMYFQHNLLEAGAHWANFPWRPANCLQDTGFPEPPPYSGDKRILMAPLFYDLSNPVRRGLDQGYIRHCLANLADEPNVIHTTGEEFTGPLSFVQFWLDTAAAWEAGTGRHPLLALSAPEDVQDAILDDSRRRAFISVIDLKYWWRTAAGGLFAPSGGHDLAPRQSERLWRKARPTPADIAAMVREYRRRFPDKAVISPLEDRDGWAVAAAGGSFPCLPPTTDPRILEALPRLQPADNPPGSPREQWVLAKPGAEYFACAAAGALRLDLSACPGPVRLRRISPRDGRVAAEETIAGGGTVSIAALEPNRETVVWLTAGR